jgi:hypothetical protein
VTEEQSVQEAAYCALTRYREDCPHLADVTSPFCHFPSAAEGAEGIYLASYADASLEMDPRYRAVVEFLQWADRRGRQWYHHYIASRMSHWDTLMAIEPYVASGLVPQEVLQPATVQLPTYMASPPIGGVVPPRGPPRTPPVVRGVRQSPYGPQPACARHFRTPPVPLPFGFGGYY